MVIGEFTKSLFYTTSRCTKTSIMKAVIVLALLLTCVAAVDWTTYTCDQISALQHSDLPCSDWITLPATTIGQGAYCVKQGNACKIITKCTPDPVLYSVLVNICGPSTGGQTPMPSSTSTGSQARP